MMDSLNTLAGLSTLLTGIVFALTAIIAIFQVARSVRQQRSSEDAAEAAEAAEVTRQKTAAPAQEQGGDVRAAWEITRSTFELFALLNRGQKQLTFWVSVLASSAGFVVMLAGVWVALRTPGQMIPSVSILAAVSGGLTQVIGATFLILYRSTVREGLVYYASLDRLNTIGLAWYIIAGMREETRSQQIAQDTARAALAISLATSAPGVAEAAFSSMSARGDIELGRSTISPSNEAPSGKDTGRPNTAEP